MKAPAGRACPFRDRVRAPCVALGDRHFLRDLPPFVPLPPAGKSAKLFASSKNRRAIGKVKPENSMQEKIRGAVRTSFVTDDHMLLSHDGKHDRDREGSEPLPRVC